MYKVSFHSIVFSSHKKGFFLTVEGTRNKCCLNILDEKSSVEKILYFLVIEKRQEVEYLHWNSGRGCNPAHA